MIIYIYTSNALSQSTIKHTNKILEKQISDITDNMAEHSKDIQYLMCLEHRINEKVRAMSFFIDELSDEIRELKKQIFSLYIMCGGLLALIWLST